MASTTVGVVPAKSPANSGDDLRRRRVDHGDRDGTTKTTAWTTEHGVDGVDDWNRSETRWCPATFGSSPGRSCRGPS
jgi:hypothetical protein